MSFKVSIATLDGKNVNEHFGQCKQFYVFQVGLDGSYKKLEVRLVNQTQNNVGFQGCNGCTNTHDNLLGTIQLLSDCKYILASRVGKNVENSLKKHGITSFSIELPIDEAIQKIVIYENRLNKFNQ